MKARLVHVGQVGNLRPIGNRPVKSIPARITHALFPLCLIFEFLHAEPPLERGKRIVNECLDALGGDRYLHVENREQSGRDYSFCREKLTGLSIAKIYTRYYSNVTDTAHELAQREPENFVKK